MENNESRIRNALTAKHGETLEFGYDTDKLKEENKYRVKGDAFPKQINKFNWGACILTPVWGIFNNTPIACLIILIGLIPYIGWILGIIFSLYCGIKGNEWAWQNKQWQSMEHFHAVQKTGQ